MKVYLIQLYCIIPFFITTACIAQTESCEFKSVNHVNRIHLTQMNDKCGEWGGNTKQIVIYRTDFTSQLLAKITYKTMICPPNRKEVNQLNIQKIQVSEEQQCLIRNAIIELTNNKLSNEEFITHSGNWNQVINSDSSLVITDYPSTGWKAFDKIYESLTKKGG